MPKTIAPVIIAVVIFIPVLYVGSYFALVVPRGVRVQRQPTKGYFSHYRAYDHPNHRFALRRIYWPLEQIDRKLRPQAWKPHAWPLTYLKPERING